MHCVVYTVTQQVGLPLSNGVIKICERFLQTLAIYVLAGVC